MFTLFPLSDRFSVVFLLVALFAASIPLASAHFSFAEEKSGEKLTVLRKVASPNRTTFYEFSNGLSLFVIERDQPFAANDSGTANANSTENAAQNANAASAPGLATVRAFVSQTGSQNEAEYLGVGISHLLEHLVCGGTTSTRSKAETTEIIDALGGGSNAFTGKELTGYYIDCSTETVPTAMALIADWLQNAALTEEEFNAEKGVVLQELLDAESDPSDVAADLLCRTVYRTHPYRHPVGGYPELLAQVTLDDVRTFYRTRYTPNNTLFVVAGAVDPDAAAEKLAELYASAPRGRELNLALPSEPVQIAARESVRELDGNMFRLQLAWPTVSLSDPDLFPLDVLAIILSNGESARLNRRIKNERRIGFAFDASSSTPASLPGIFVITALTLPEDLAPVEAAIADELAKLAELAVPPEELAKAKKQCEAAFVFGRESLSSVAQSTAFNYLMTGNPDFDTQYLTGIRAVTAEDLRRVARKYFLPERRNRVLIAPIGMAPKNIEAQKASEPEKITAFKLPGNGLRLLLKKSDALPKVTIQIYALGGALLDSDATAGRSALLAEMLSAGSETRSRTELENWFDSVGGLFTFQAGRNTLGASAVVLKEDFPEALALLSDALLHPAFPEEEFTKAKKELESRIARRSDQPMSELFETFSLELPAASPYHLLLDGTKESVNSLTTDALRSYHRTVFAPENMIISIFGAIDPQEASALIEKHFGALVKGNAAPVSFDRRNELIQQIDRHRTTQKKTGLGIIAWPTVSVRDAKEYAALTLLQTVLGGYRYPGGRLFEELRKEGLVYRLSVDQMIGPAPGYFYAVFETRPDAVAEVFDRIDKGIERIKNGDLDAAELERAKRRVLAFHPQELETLASQAQKAALDDLYGLGYNNDAGFNARIEAVTLDDVLAAARKYFNQRITVSTSPNESR